MYDRSLVAHPASRVTLTSGETSRTVDLYSPEGMGLVAALWLKLCCEYRVMYEPTWLGIPIIQLPADIVMMQELVWKLRPDVIVECGVARGGSAVLYASICELLGRGRVIAVDVEIRPQNRRAIEGHPLAGRIELVEGSSTDPATVAQVRRRVEGAGGARTVMVVLDSNHSTDHVLREMTAYHGMVTPGSYLVVMDGAAAHVWEVPRGQAQYRDDNPLEAIGLFLRDHPEFRPDPHYTRMHVTACPDGFLQRLGPGGPTDAPASE